MCRNCARQKICTREVNNGYVCENIDAILEKDNVDMSFGCLKCEREKNM
jgi:hypothetical protein